MSELPSMPCKAGSIELIVLYWALNTATWNEFHIESIRWEAFFQSDKSLSYKQVRDALFRLRAKGLAVRHVARGSYKFVTEEV